MAIHKRGHPGICPVCNDDELEYSQGSTEDHCTSLPYQCPNCNFRGIEFCYKHSFGSHLTDDEQAIYWPKR